MRIRTPYRILGVLLATGLTLQQTFASMTIPPSSPFHSLVRFSSSSNTEALSEPALIQALHPLGKPKIKGTLNRQAALVHLLGLSAYLWLTNPLYAQRWVDKFISRPGMSEGEYWTKKILLYWVMAGAAYFIILQVSRPIKWVYTWWRRGILDLINSFSRTPIDFKVEWGRNKIAWKLAKDIGWELRRHWGIGPWKSLKLVNAILLFTPALTVTKRFTFYYFPSLKALEDMLERLERMRSVKIRVPSDFDPQNGRQVADFFRQIGWNPPYTCKDYSREDSTISARQEYLNRYFPRINKDKTVPILDWGPEGPPPSDNPPPSPSEPPPSPLGGLSSSA